MNADLAKQIIQFIQEEERRVEYGKLFIEVTVAGGRSTNIQCETKRSMNIRTA